jgi:hypothetical protein
MLRAVIAIVMSALLICAGALLVGQVVLRLCGVSGWSWLAPAVGMAVLMLVAVPALYVPGRSLTMAIVLALVVAGCAVAVVRDRSSWPPLGGLTAALPTGLLALVPFAASGYAGILGVSFNNDMGAHLIWAEAYRSEAIASVNVFHSGYPFGPHALAAALAEGLGIAVDEAFTGLTVAIPVLLAWTALGALRKVRWPAQIVVATLVGMPFLIAGYYSQGSFKELLQAMFVLAFAIFLQRRADFRGPLRWVPAALLIAGILSVYSAVGLAWPIAILGLWVLGSAVERLRRGDKPRDLVQALRRNLAPVAAALALLVVVLIPQLARVARFVSDSASTNGTGIEAGSLGNLAGPLPLWEAFGVWDNPDYRLPAVDPLANGVWIGLVLALVLVGTVWWVRRGDWAVPAAAAAAFVVWAISDRSQAPYVVAKGLVILTPLLMLVAVRPLVERATISARWPPPWGLAGPAIALVLAAAVVSSSWGALRTAKIGSRAHYEELSELRPLVGKQPTVFLGNDDFISWELAGVPLTAPVIGVQLVPTRRQKQWTYGEPLDLDSLPAAELDRHEWIIAPRDAAGSAAPKGLRRVRVTPSFELWRRVGPVQRRVLLDEGPNAAVPFDCSTPRARRLLKAGGVAAVRRPSVTTPVEQMTAGSERDVELPLGDGLWTVQMQYDSQQPIEVSGPGLRRTLPASLDRPGTRWRVGRMRVSGGAGAVVRLRVTDTALTPPGRNSYINAIIATPVGGSRTVPLREACGKYVDWIEPRRP